MAGTCIHFFPHIHSFSMKVSLKAGDHLPITQQLDSLGEPLKGRREGLDLLVKGKALVFKFHDPVSFVTLVSSFSSPLALPPPLSLPGFLRFFCLFVFVDLTAWVFSAYLPIPLLLPPVLFPSHSAFLTQFPVKHHLKNGQIIKP